MSLIGWLNAPSSTDVARAIEVPNAAASIQVKRCCFVTSFASSRWARRVRWCVYHHFCVAATCAGGWTPGFA